MRSRLILTLAVLALGLHISYGAVAQEANDRQSASPARKIYEQTASAIVSITAQNEDGEDIRSGTGFLIDPKWLRTDIVRRLDGLEELREAYSHVGFVVTNFHVIEGAVAATFRTNTSSAEGRSGSITLRPFHVELEDRHADIALLSVTASAAPAVHLELSAIAPNIGDRVYTIGNALGLTASLADGIVSGIRLEPTTGVELLQTTVPISPGSSGGPLLDSDGRVVGIVTSTFVEGQNVNFAVSHNELASFLKYEYRRYRDYSPRSLSDGTSFAAANESALWQLEYAACGLFGSPRNDTLLKAVTALREGRPDDAAALLKEATLPPRSVLAEFHWAVGAASYDSAINGTNLDQMAQIDSNPNYIRSIEAFEKSIKLDPDFVPALHALSMSYPNRGDWHRALGAAHSLVIAAPDCAESYALRGWIADHLGDHESAISDYQRGLGLNPKYGKLYSMLGLAYGKDDRAADAFLSAIRLGYLPQDSEYRLGNHYRDTGKYEAAIAAYQRALARDDDGGVSAATLRESIDECRKLIKR